MHAQWATKEDLASINLNGRFSTKNAGRNVEVRPPKRGNANRRRSNNRRGGGC